LKIAQKVSSTKLRLKKFATLPENLSAFKTMELRHTIKLIQILDSEIRLTCGENIFAWHGGSFGNYRSFKIYLLNFQEWRVKNL